MANDPTRLARLFGRDDLLPLWVAEPYVDLAPVVVDAMRQRADVGWYGYEMRPKAAVRSFWEWMDRRHGWSEDSLQTAVSPSVGTSIGVILDLFSEAGDGVILQPPVFTDFKPLVNAANRSVVKNPLVRTDGGYQMDLDHLATQVTDPSVSLLILCNPHNPVGRAWSIDELKPLAKLCADNDVFVLADEVHADLVLGENEFTPFASVAEGLDVRWAATHGPIKTFGLAGIADTLVVTDDADVTSAIRSLSSRLHLTRNNVFGVAATTAAYQSGDSWLDDFLELVANNLTSLREGLPDVIDLVEPDATFLAWLDFRALDLDAQDLVRWLTDAGLALSPGHWFGREGAGYARMTIAAPTAAIDEAVARLGAAVQRA